MASTGSFAVNIILLIILLIGSALISGAEVAFFSLSQTDINDIEDEKINPG